ncbi:MAG: hypothetical protein II102_02760 [Bacteroidales bacterium]|jgi:hypothetical protein|nr:hypothetical protein [Bacteroidales bacterium]MBQ1682711.1 hypothetical protein [Bacteroidales bacterium]
MKMKHLILVITFFVLGYPVFAQNKSITVKGQRCYLNNEDIYDAIIRDRFAVMLNTNGFYGPYTISDEIGSSKEYWYNKSYADNHPASSIFLYSGARLEYDSFSRYGVQSTTTIEQTGVTSVRGYIDTLFFRSDYYCDNRLIISYYFVRQSDIQLFDRLVDCAFSELHPSHLYLVALSSSLDSNNFNKIWLFPEMALEEFISIQSLTFSTIIDKNECHCLSIDSYSNLMEFIRQNKKKAFIHRGNRGRIKACISIIPISGFVFKTKNIEDKQIYFCSGPYCFWEKGRHTKEYSVLKYNWPSFLDCDSQFNIRER